jgi:hypothetical protein
MVTWAQARRSTATGAVVAAQAPPLRS